MTTPRPCLPVAGVTKGLALAWWLSLAAVGLAQAPSVAPAAQAAFAAVSPVLAAITLNDPENGEVLGTALDLIERVEAEGTSGDGTGPTRLQVMLVSGAADRLRRSAEFERRDDAFVRATPVEVRVVVAADRTRAVVEVAPRR